MRWDVEHKPYTTQALSFPLRRACSHHRNKIRVRNPATVDDKHFVDIPLVMRLRYTPLPGTLPLCSVALLFKTVLGVLLKKLIPPAATEHLKSYTCAYLYVRSLRYLCDHVSFASGTSVKYVLILFPSHVWSKKP